MKTHWRKIHDTEHLGAQDLEGLASKIYQIEKAFQKDVQNQDGKKDTTIALQFLGEKKPMLVNVTNSQSIEKVTGSPYLEDWNGHYVELYVTQVRAFGAVVDALRIRPKAPVLKKPTLDIGSAQFAKLRLKLLDGTASMDVALQHFEIPVEVQEALLAPF
jgi:hypothetical protein